MFDFGFSEMMIVAVVALVVLGPEKLPRVARQAGEWMGKLQRYVADVKSDINRQMELDELKRVQEELKGAAQSLQAEVSSAVTGLQSEVDSIHRELNAVEDTLGPDHGGHAATEPAPTDWDRVYALRRTRERIKERRRERSKDLALLRKLR
jgi:sec-independent protein translocase protein TatB